MTELIDVLFVGQTGVGKSTLINMVRHKDKQAPLANVSNDADACTLHTTSYGPVQLGTGSCQLWDTRGLDEAVDNRDRFMSRIVQKIRQFASRQERELRETIQSRTKNAKPILVWCMDAAKIEVPFHWQQFRKVYVEYCEEKAKPMVVLINRTSPRKTHDWQSKCEKQLQSLGLRTGLGNTEVSLLYVQKHGQTSSTEYTEDGDALRELISQLVGQANAQS